MSFAKAGAHTSSSAEDHSAEAAKRKREVNAANHRHSDEVRPDDGKIGTAIQNRLREGDEMWGWADYPHHVLQPDGHALHRRGAAGQKLHDKKHGSREQRELAHGSRDSAEQDAERGDREGVERGPGEKESQ